MVVFLSAQIRVQLGKKWVLAVILSENRVEQKRPWCASIATA